MTRKYTKFQRYAKSVENYSYAVIRDKYAIVSVPDKELEQFTEPDSEQDCFDKITNQEVKELNLELAQHIIKNIDKILTPHQAEVLKQVILEGLTQAEAGNNLNCHQSSIHKSLYGNLTYQGKCARQGGSTKKILKWVQSDKTAQDILKKIKDKQNE